MDENFKSLIVQRRSHRKFAETPLSEEQIRQLLEIALMAPAGKRANPWEFVVVTNKNTLQALSTCKPNGSAFVAQSPLSIVVIADTNKSDVWIEDCSIAAIYLQLAAEAMGLGSCWAQVRQRVSCTEGVMAETYIKELLNIPDNYAVECIVSIGYKGDERKPFDPSHLQWEKCHKEQF